MAEEIKTLEVGDFHVAIEKGHSKYWAEGMDYWATVNLDDPLPGTEIKHMDLGVHLSVGKIRTRSDKVYYLVGRAGNGSIIDICKSPRTAERICLDVIVEEVTPEGIIRELRFFCEQREKTEYVRDKGGSWEDSGYR